MLPFLEFPGGWRASTYSATACLAMLGGYVYLLWRARELRVHAHRVAELWLIALALGVLGARLWPIALEDPLALIAHPGRSMLAGRGLSSLGALMLALPGGLLYLTARKLPVWPLLAAATPAVAGGLSLMRVGCLARGCCYGIVTAVPWGFPQPLLSGSPEPRHPAQLYETLALGALALGLHRLSRRGAEPRRTCGIFALGVATIRFVIEYVRPHEAANLLLPGLSVSQALWGVLALVGLALLSGRSRPPAGIAPGPDTH